MYKKLLVAISLADEAGLRIIETAKGLLADGGKLDVLYVLDTRFFQFVYEPLPRGEGMEEFVADAMGKARKKLVALCAGSGIDATQATVLLGRPATVIRETATNEAADLIVMGTHGSRGWRRLLGSVANEVLHGTPTSVFLCRSAFVRN